MYTCNSCLCEYSSLQSLKKHQLNKHPTQRKDLYQNVDSPKKVFSNFDMFETGYYCEEEESTCIEEHIKSTEKQQKKISQMRLTKFLEKSLEEIRLSKNQEQKVINIFENYTSLLKSGNLSQIDEPNWNLLRNFRARVNNKFKTLQIQKPKVHILDNLGKYTVCKLRLIDLLKIYCNDDVMDALQRERLTYLEKSRKGVYYSIYDGELLRSIEYFKQFPDALKLGLYLDAISIAGKKRLLIYIFLCDLDILIRCDPNHYLLYTACDLDVLKEYGFDAIFELILPEILELGDPEGVTIRVNQSTKTFKGRLFVIIGDNEMLNTVAGLSTAFQNVFATCRRCYQKINKCEKGNFQERSKFQNVEYFRINIPKKTTLAGLVCDTWINYINDFLPEKQLAPDISHDIHGGEIPRQIFATLSALILDKIITLEQYNKMWKSFCQQMHLNRFLTMSTDIHERQLFIENNENNYKNSFKFYESYLRLYTFPMILLLMVKDIEVFNHKHVHRLMCFKAFVHLIMKKDHTDESLNALEDSYNLVLDNNLRCGMKPVLKTHTPKHYKSYIKELGTLRGLMTNTGENANQINKNDNYSTRNVCYSLLTNFIMRFKPYSKRSLDVNFSKFTIIDTKLYNYKDFISCIGSPKCKSYSYFMLFGMKIETGTCLKMHDEQYIVVDDILENIANGNVFVSGRICKSVILDEILQYKYYSSLGEKKLYPINSIEQVVLCYEHKDITYMIIHFDRFLIRNAKLDNV